MRILVTGSSGHVGGAITRGLASLGWQVVGLSRRSCEIPGLAQQIQADLGRLGIVEQVTAQTDRCQAIVHAAACLDKALDEPSIALANCLGTQQVIALSRRWKVNHIVYISGIGVLGRPIQVPITENHPIDPPTAYHASKVFGEQLMALASRDGIPAASLRLTSPVGPGMPAGRILSIFVCRALSSEPLELAGSGTRRQDYVDVRDVASGALACLEAGAMGLYNLAAGVSVSNRELAEQCVRQISSASPIRFTGNPDPEEGIDWNVSIARAARSFGYAPRHTLEETIRAVVAEYAHRNHR